MSPPVYVDVSEVIQEATVNVPVKLRGMWRLRIGLAFVRIGFAIMGTVCNVGSIEVVETESEPTK